MSHSTVPASRVSRSERRRWQAIVRRLEHAFESDHLSTLRNLAAGRAPVQRLWSPGAGGLLTGPVQLMAGERRLALARVQTQAWRRLSAAVGTGPVALAGAARYGRGWALTFRGPHAEVTLLADHVRFLPSDGGEVGDCGSPLELVVG